MLMTKRVVTRYGLVYDLPEDYHKNGSRLLSRVSHPLSPRVNASRSHMTYFEIFYAQVYLPHIKNLLESIFGNDYKNQISSQVSLARTFIMNLALALPQVPSEISYLFENGNGRLRSNQFNGEIIHLDLERLAMDGDNMGFSIRNTDFDVNDFYLSGNLVVLARVARFF